MCYHRSYEPRIKVCRGVDRAKASAVLALSSRLNHDWYGKNTSSEDGAESGIADDDEQQ
jgi:hypothetical protein